MAHREEAELFYRKLSERRLKARVGMEASGHSRRFERLLGELQFELWIGNAAEIRTKRVRKQKTDRQDAQLLLRLMIEDLFPRIWVPDSENRDLRQLLWHRHRMVQKSAARRSRFFHLAMRRGRKIATVAMARKLAVHLCWMWRQGWEYGQMQKLGSHAGEPGNPDGEQ